MNYSDHNVSVSKTTYYNNVYGLIKEIFHKPGYPITYNQNNDFIYR